MGRRKNENIRKVQRNKGTYFVSIPIDVVRDMKLREQQKVVVEYEKRAGKIVIRDWKK